MKNKYMLLKKGSKYLIIDLVKVRLFNLRRRVFAWARVIQPLSMMKGVKMAMFRLSYDLKGTMIEKQITAVGDIKIFMHRVRQRLGKRLLAYAWVAEVHADGTLHYHVCILYLGGWFGMPDRAYWGLDTKGRKIHFERMWKKGCTHSEFHVKTPYYMASYVGKEYQKDYMKLPDNFHAWAVFVSDEALKLNLKIESLTKLERLEFESIVKFEGLEIEEAWTELKWMTKYRRRCQAEQELNWEFGGLFNDVKQVEKWGITQELLDKKMYTSINSEIEIKPEVQPHFTVAEIIGL